MTYQGTLMGTCLYHQKMSYVKDHEQSIDSKRLIFLSKIDFKVIRSNLG